MTRLLTIGGVLAVGMFSMSVAAYQQPAAPPAPRVVEVEKLKDNLYVMKGGGGNRAVFIGTDGVTVVDTKNPGWGQPLLEKIKSVTDKPVARIINTHTHGDHVSGNVEFPATVEIVVQETPRPNMEAMRPVTGLTAPPAGPSIFQQNNGRGLPTKHLQGHDDHRQGRRPDRSVLLRRAPTPAATRSWCSRRSASMHTGDAFHTRDLPIMDKNNGGSGVEFPATLAKAAAVPNVDTIINGHNPTTTTPADMKTQSEFIAEFVKFVQDARRRARPWTTWPGPGRRQRPTPTMRSPTPTACAPTRR